MTLNRPPALQVAERPLAIVIVTYNSAHVLGACLDSLGPALAGRTARVVVVDNASADDTLTVAKNRVPDVEIVARSTNDGFGAGVNAGLAVAEGCDVLVLNPDIRLHPRSIAVLQDELRARSAGIVVPLLLDAEGRRWDSLRRRPTVLRALGEALLGGTRAGRIPLFGESILDSEAYRRPRPIVWATGAAFLVSADCLAATRRLDERYFLYSEETEYMLRAADHGFELWFEPRAVATHLGGQQLSSSQLSTLSVTNRVRLHRERYGTLAGMAMRLALILNEAPRALFGKSARRRIHLASVRSLATMRRWPTRPDAGPDYVLFAAQDWWYHNRSHSDFQLIRSVAARRRVLVINSIGLRMPIPGRTTQTTRRILRKLRSVAKLVRRPVPELPGFFVMSPLPLPLYSRSWTRRLNATLVRAQVRLACFALGIQRPIVVMTLPTAWDIVAPIDRRAIVYNRSDRHSAFIESDAAAIESLERTAMQRADHVLYASSALLAEERHLTGDRAHLLDHGVDLEHFVPRSIDTAPREILDVPEPRIGFFGALDDQVVDFDLLERVAVDLPDVSLVLIGDATRPMDTLTKYPNVYWFGFREYERIPEYGSRFDVALMPWLDNEWIRYANPIKLKEYLALGLPVVTTDFAEIDRYRHVVHVAANHAEFVELIRQTLLDSGPADPRTRRAFVARASWQSRADELIELVEGHYPQATPST